MDIDRIDDTLGQPPGEHPARFQGYAKIQRLPNPFVDGPAVFAVHFDAGGRTRPHVHHSGQLLHVTSGRGVVATESTRRVVEAGDVVAVAAGEWHWHGATAGSPMTHVTVQRTGEDPIDWEVDEKDWATGYESLQERPASSAHVGGRQLGEVGVGR